MSALYRSKDAPRYITGGKLFSLHLFSRSDALLVDAVELTFVGIGLVAVSVALYSYRRINASRDKLMQELTEKGVPYSEETWTDMGDLSPDFRYTL